MAPVSPTDSPSFFYVSFLSCVAPLFIYSLWSRQRSKSDWLQAQGLRCEEWWMMFCILSVCSFFFLIPSSEYIVLTSHGHFVHQSTCFHQKLYICPPTFIYLVINRSPFLLRSHWGWTPLPPHPPHIPDLPPQSPALVMKHGSQHVPCLPLSLFIFTISQSLSLSLSSRSLMFVQT